MTGVSVEDASKLRPRTSPVSPTSVDEENLSDLGLASPLFALVRLVPPQLVGHLNRDHRWLAESVKAPGLDEDAAAEAAATLELRPIP